jgi:hypothetical protein
MSATAQMYAFTDGTARLVRTMTLVRASGKRRAVPGSRPSSVVVHPPQASAAVDEQAEGVMQHRAVVKHAGSCRRCKNPEPTDNMQS